MHDKILTFHPRSDLSCYSGPKLAAPDYKNKVPCVRVARWYQGNVVNGSTLELTPEEARELASELNKMAAEAEKEIVAS